MRRRPLAGILLLVTLPAAAASATPEPAPLVARAWAEWAACGQGCKGESGLGAELWKLRRRLADRDTLISMAVAVEQGEDACERGEEACEQGEDACLCGKTNPTATDVERQGLLIADALPKGPVRIALPVGAGQRLTHDHPRSRYEHLLLVRLATAPRPPTP